ncbi:MAG: signal recognition particle subunit SRP19/SEC65 family protein [Desulfurococcaceae archaeon]
MSRDHRASRIYVYPNYFSANLSRQKGRKVPLNLAIPSTSLEELLKVCEDLGLNPILEHDKAHPRYTPLRGRISVNKQGSKLKTLYCIARGLKEYRKYNEGLDKR